MVRKITRLTYEIANENSLRFKEFRQATNRHLDMELRDIPAFYIQAKVKTKNNWDKPHLFLYDTGSPITFLKKSYKNIISSKKSMEYSFGGLYEEGSGEFEIIPASLMFQDMQGKTSPEIRTIVAIPKYDDIDLQVIGMIGIANTHNFITDPKKGKFYLDFY